MELKVTMKLSFDSWERLIDSPAKLRVLGNLKIGGVLTERRLAKYAGLSHVAVSRILEEFERFHLASSKRVGRANLWSLNQGSYALAALQPLLKALGETPSPKQALIQAVKAVLPLSHVERVVFFGSVTDGTERDESDVDLGVVLNPKGRKRDPALEKGLDQLRTDCYRLFGKRISPTLFSWGEWQRKQKTPLAQSLLKGEKIYP